MDKFGRQTLLAFFAALFMLGALLQSTGRVYGDPSYAESPLAPDADAAISRIGSGSYRYSFGTIRVLDTPAIECPITLRNRSAAPIEIREVSTSCGCTSAMLVSNRANSQPSPPLALPVELAPAGAVTLCAEIDASRLESGSVQKSVFVRTDCGDFTVELDGDAIGAARFSVDTLDFGSVRAGQQVSQRIAVLLDPRIADAPFHIISDDPDVLVTAAPAQNRLRREFLVRLALVPRLGPIYATLTLLPDNPAGESSMYGSVYLSVEGDVRSDVEASPTEAVFGLVKAGRPAQLDVALDLPASSRGTVRASASAPYIRASLSQPERQADGKRKITLNIDLTDSAPVGRIASQVTVTTSSGARFAIPVVATVASFASSN